MKISTINTFNNNFRSWLEPEKYRQQILESAERVNVPSTRRMEILSCFNWLENNSKNYDIEYKNDKNCLSLTLNHKKKCKKTTITTYLNDDLKNFGAKLSFLLDYTIQKINQ